MNLSFITFADSFSDPITGKSESGKNTGTLILFLSNGRERERERERRRERDRRGRERGGERESSDYTEFGGFFTRARFSLSHRSPLSQSKTQAIIEILGQRGNDNRIEVVKPVTPSCLFPCSPQIFSSGKEPIPFFPSFRTNLIQVVKNLSMNFGIPFLSAPKATGPQLKRLSQENYQEVISLSDLPTIPQANSSGD